jgi:hypothetical protein
MQIAGFSFTIGELDGYRFIESVFPSVFDQKRLWAAASSYPTLWDETKTTVTLNDVTAMGDLDAEAHKVLRWVLQQNMIRARLLATSWVIGDNERAGEQIREVLVEVGRPADNLFATRDEALAFLRERIRTWEAGSE